MKIHALVAAGLMLGVSPLFAWDIPGHIIVAKIAYDQSTPNARKKLDALAQTLTFDILVAGKPPIHHTFNGVNIAGWPDEVKHASSQQTPMRDILATGITST